jgi:hypothetical protein
MIPLNKRISLRKILGAVSIVFIALNLITFVHAYRFSHFSADASAKTARPEKLSLLSKVGVLFNGIENPKPRNGMVPVVPYATVVVKTRNGNKIHSWLITVPAPKGTVILFHGYTGSKSQLLTEAAAFNAMGYHTLLVDLAGHGGSEGYRTTLGYYEGADVEAVFQYIRSRQKQPVFLYGASMGAVSIMRAVSQYGIQPDGLLLECPFGSMLQAAQNRFALMGIPTFPGAQLLVFWGGVQNGYWGFDHNAVEYASHITVPTLLMFGVQDKRVNKEEIEAIFSQLAGKKKLVYFQKSEHQSYYKKEPQQWLSTVQPFLNKPTG